MSCCALGSVKGHDECFPENVHVVTEKRLYPIYCAAVQPFSALLTMDRTSSEHSLDEFDGTDFEFGERSRHLSTQDDISSAERSLASADQLDSTTSPSGKNIFHEIIES